MSTWNRLTESWRRPAGSQPVVAKQLSVTSCSSDRNDEEPGRHSCQDKRLNNASETYVGAKLRVLSDIEAVLEACRNARIDHSFDHHRRSCVGEAVISKVIDLSDDTVKCHVPSLGLDIWFAARALEADREDPARVAELEVALVRERQLAKQKDEELQATSQLITRLQQALEVQQREQERIATLEEAVSRQHDSEDGRVEKLLLAVAGGKQLAEERVDELKRTEEQLEEERRLLAEEQARRRGLEGQLAEKDRRLKDIKAKLDDDASARTLLEQQLLEKQKEVRDAQRQLSEERQKHEAAVGQLAAAQKNQCADGDGGAAQEQINELQQQLSNELSRRRVTQYQHLKVLQKMTDVRQQLSEERGGTVSHPVVHPPPSWQRGAPVPGLPEEREEVFAPTPLTAQTPWSPGAREVLSGDVLSSSAPAASATAGQVLFRRVVRTPAPGPPMRDASPPLRMRDGSPVRFHLPAGVQTSTPDQSQQLSSTVGFNAGSVNLPPGQAQYRTAPSVYYVQPASGGALAPDTQARLRRQSMTFA